MPIFAVPKKDGDGNYTMCRPVADYRGLNALLQDDAFPLPKVKDIYRALAGSHVFSTLDLKSAFHRLPVHPEHQHKTAFTWEGQQYVFRRAPFGLKTMPSKFQRLIQHLMGGLPFARAFMDDIVVYSKDMEEHTRHLAAVLDILTPHNLQLNASKCRIGHVSLNLLGFVVTPTGQEIQRGKLVNVADWPVPTHGKQLQHYLGFINYFREHIPMAAELTAPLDALRNEKELDGLWTDVLWTVSRAV